jgi:hypothetical protein
VVIFSLLLRRSILNFARYYLYVSITHLDAAASRKVLKNFSGIPPPYYFTAPGPASELLVYFTFDAVRNFPHLLYQTRYLENCFAHRVLADTLARLAAGTGRGTSSMLVGLCCKDVNCRSAAWPDLAIGRGDTTHILSARTADFFKFVGKKLILCT